MKTVLAQTIISPIKTAQIKLVKAASAGVTAPQAKPDVHYFVALRELQTKTFEQLGAKLNTQTVTKADITKLLDSFEGIDKEYAKEILLQSADNLSFANVMKKIQARYPQNLSGAKIILDQDGQAVSYLAAKRNVDNYDDCYSGKFPSPMTHDRISVIGKIFTQPLSKEEFLNISKFPTVNIPDVGLEHTLNFLDFAIDPSGEMAKKKTEAIIKRARKYKATGSSPEEAISLAINETLLKNIGILNKIRQQRGLDMIDHIIFPPIKKINSVQGLIDHLSQNELTAEKIHERFAAHDSKIIRNPDYLKLLTSENGFSFYTPQKTIEALKGISKKIQEQLQHDNISPENAYFISRENPKSDWLMGYMFEKIGDFDKKQFINHVQAEKLAEEGFFKDKAIIYLDDINGSGFTVGHVYLEFKAPIKQSKAFYVAHLESNWKGRDLSRDRATQQIYHHDSENILDETHPFYQELSNPESFKETVEKWDSFMNSGSTQGFFFSIPDNLVDAVKTPVEDCLRISGINITG